MVTVLKEKTMWSSLARGQVSEVGGVLGAPPQLEKGLCLFVWVSFGGFFNGNNLNLK